jgi:L-alanine-DL-glutamate epimerase-like enolase superfamily enzyme
MGLLDDLWVHPPDIKDGFITAPERPGHGLEFKDGVRKELMK